MKDPATNAGESEKQENNNFDVSVQRLIDAVHDLQLDLLVLPSSLEREAVYELTDSALPYLDAALKFLAIALKKGGRR